LMAPRQRGAHPAVAMFARMLRLKERSMLKSLLFALLAAAALATQAQERPDHVVPDAQAIAAERVARNYHERIAAQIADSGQARDVALGAGRRDLAVADPRERAQGDGQATPWRSAAAGRAGADVLANAMLMMSAGAGAGAGPGDGDD